MDYNVESQNNSTHLSLAGFQAMTQSPVTIVPVSNRAQQKQFIRYAWKLYEGDENWVPPLIMNQKELLNYKPHPFYENAEIQTFLAMRDSQICGRVAAIIDHGHNQTHKEKRGMFGFFESVDDQEVANALLDQVQSWHAAKGISLMRGPLNPAMNYECGMLIDGFDSKPTFMMTYNKDYYPKLIETWGFKKTQDLFAYWGHIDMLNDLDPKLMFVAEEAKRRFNVNVRRISKKNFKQDVESFLDIYNKALPGTWGFVPLSDSELTHMAAGLKQLIVPGLTTIGEVDGRPVAVSFGLLDYNPLIKEIDGKLFPFGVFKLLFKRKHIKRVRLISTNVLPEYQRWGLGIVLMNRLIPDVKAWGIEEGEFSWVLETNKLSRGTLERAGAKLIKTYRIYDFEP